MKLTAAVTLKAAGIKEAAAMMTKAAAKAKLTAVATSTTEVKQQ